ncbi:MAG: hypothetical protein GY833_21535 [Aestuariibacter sp.]|nr:hypothetical protein [Aestuariibacter sp.]
MYEVNVSDKLMVKHTVPYRIIWGMPSRKQLQDAANYDGLTVVIFTHGHKHTVKTNQLLHRQLDSLQIKKGALRDRRTLKHYILVYSAPPFTSKWAAEDYFESVFNPDAKRAWRAPAGRYRGSLNLIDALL